MARPLPERLRSATATPHARAHELWRLDRPDLDARTYTACLAQLQGAARAWAPVLASAPPPCGPVLPRHRWLAADVAEATGRFGPPPDYPRCPPPPATAYDPDAVLGAHYVWEGSGLGAAVLLPHVQAALPGAPHAYLAQLRGHAPRRWRKMCRALRQVPEAAHPRVEAGAVTAFEALVAHLQRCADAPACTVEGPDGP